MKEEFVFAGAPYSNSAPLVDKLIEVDSRVKVINDHPANLVDDLNSGRCDVALIPVAHLFRHPELTMLEGLGIASDGPVKSVLLKCNAPVSEIQTVERDPASATSNALAELLLRNHYNLDVVMCDSGRMENSDAVVVIGDRALQSDPAPAGDIDLSGAWKEMTGLPFVFAVWAVRKDYAELKAVTEIAHKAYRAGMQCLNSFAERYARSLGGDESFWVDYLNETIHYELTEDDLRGLDCFRKMSCS